MITISKIVIKKDGRKEYIYKSGNMEKVVFYASGKKEVYFVDGMKKIYENGCCYTYADGRKDVTV